MRYLRFFGTSVLVGLGIVIIGEVRDLAYHCAEYAHARIIKAAHAVAIEHGWNPPKNPLTESEIVFQAADNYAIHPRYIQAMKKVESNDDMEAVSSKGAVCAMQVMPSTAKLQGRNPALVATDLRECVEAGAQVMNDGLFWLSVYYNGGGEGLEVVTRCFNAKRINKECLGNYEESWNHAIRVQEALRNQ